MRRRTLEEKLEAIRLVEEGNSPRSVSDRLHIGHHQIYEWLYIYKEKGVSGLENKRDIENCCSWWYICLWLFKYTISSAVLFFFLQLSTIYHSKCRMNLL